MDYARKKMLVFWYFKNYININKLWLKQQQSCVNEFSKDIM